MTINDPVFGTLEHGVHGWLGTVKVFGYDLELNFAGDPTQGKNVAYQHLFTQFLELETSLKASLERAVIDYHTSNLEEFRMWCSAEEEEELVPAMHKPEDVWAQATPFCIRLDCEDSTQPEIYIEFRTTWDEEHGMDVTFRDNKLGIADAGASWSRHTLYDLTGNPL
jgi:hypothetical protein